MTSPALNKKAPAIQLPNQEGETVQLSDFKGRPVVLYFYPKDNTPGCTTQACDLRDNYSKFDQYDAVVLGVSPDGPAKHTKFIGKFDLPFTLLADEEKTVCEAYGVWQLKKFMGREYMGVVRTTFIIGADGKIKNIFEKVKVKAHTEQVLEALAELAK